MEKPFPSPESKKEITREEIIAAYKKFIKQGVRNPDDLDLENPEVKEAQISFLINGESRKLY